ncbi:xanthine dehydrogenase family protein molybdopterin-binding subunit [Natrarchaeobius oligotrophus]|uniref:Xanthine dehydrogenase family protein molybdopterin-binding subunit n=1 Tax=Natrarchaeobius chitinivorans TaxID=1679083 RepID=A0A3N6PGJ7_NATCH|nr:xanthine dehydrogenase family protein molybdopterin-binding subunit [Natrarchaeobius chitinivorans]RQG99419.1 xanthine dehydrogenase family protein molybdopterin-binding subunit [Natrarchaeobius chitinivorans]
MSQAEESKAERVKEVEDHISNQPTPQNYVGSEVRRKEDEKILKDHREYVQDRNPPDALHAAYVRSPHAHAEITDIDTSAAEEHDECKLVMTVDDYRDAGYAPMLCGIQEWAEWPLADGKVTYVGQCVAMVVATDRYVAEDIADLVEVEYERLDPLVDVMEARDSDNVLYPEMGPNAPSNVAFDETFELGDPDGVFEEADHVIEKEFDWESRASGVPLETPSALGTCNMNPEDGEEKFHVWSNQQLHTWADVAIYAALDQPREEVRVEVPLTAGGSYGTKHATVYRHAVLTAVASEMVGGNPVKYVEDRIEDLQGGDSASTDRHYKAKIAFNDDGEILANDFWLADNFGAFPRFICTNQVLKPLAIVNGPYDVEHARYEYEIVCTNKMPQTSYRGFGTPAHSWVWEMLMDEAADVLDMDPTEIRLKNYIDEEDMPYKTPSANVYGEGDYAKTVRKVWDLVEDEKDGGLLDPDRVEELREEGIYRGSGSALVLEPGLGCYDYHTRQFIPRDELATYYTPENRDFSDVVTMAEPLEAYIRTDGKVVVKISSDDQGQGHQTIASQMLADELGITPDDVVVPQQDNLDVASDVGSASSRMATVMSSAAIGLGEKLRGQLEELAADHWGIDTEQVEFDEGGVKQLSTEGVEPVDKRHAERLEQEFLTLTELVHIDKMMETGDSHFKPQAELKTYAYYEYPDVAYENREYFEEAMIRKRPTYPSISFAANVPIVDVDVETGEIEIQKIYSVRDSGRIINPMIVEGQHHGGIMQGIGAALQEEFGYSEDGQPQSTTFFDMMLPSIENLPELEIEKQETWSVFSKSGAKGVGETGIMDIPASLAHSVNDALKPLDVTVEEMPMTPNRVRSWIRDAGDAPAPADD